MGLVLPLVGWGFAVWLCRNNINDAQNDAMNNSSHTTTNDGYLHKTKDGIYYTKGLFDLTNSFHLEDQTSKVKGYFRNDGCITWHEGRKYDKDRKTMKIFPKWSRKFKRSPYEIWAKYGTCKSNLINLP